MPSRQGSKVGEQIGGLAGGIASAAVPGLAPFAQPITAAAKLVGGAIGGAFTKSAAEKKREELLKLARMKGPAPKPPPDTGVGAQLAAQQFALGPEGGARERIDLASSAFEQQARSAAAARKEDVEEFGKVQRDLMEDTSRGLRMAEDKESTTPILEETMASVRSPEFAESLEKIKARGRGAAGFEEALGLFEEEDVAVAAGGSSPPLSLEDHWTEDKHKRRLWELARIARGA